MKELFQAIFSHYDSSTDFKNSLTGGFSYGQGKHSCAYPYAVYSSYAATPEDTFSAEIDDVAIQINIYSKKAGPGECFDLLQLCKELFNKSVLPVSNHENVRLIKEMEQPPIISDGKIWMAVIEFNCMLQKS